ncbi:MAG: hypothetical protein R3B72_21555 [Polyangiaceae bacterium]
MMIRRLLTATAILTASTPALAAADLSVDVQTPTVAVYDTGSYDVVVENVGNRRARNVTLTIDLPETNTSPTVYLLGDLDTYDSRCSLSGRQLTCALGTLRQNRSTTVSLDLMLPLSTAPIQIGASVSSPDDGNASNDSDVEAADLTTYPVAINAPVAATNRHCTSSSNPGLTSFYECELFPSSISSHGITLQSNGSISFANAPPSFTGSWSQTSSDHLSLQYFDGGQLVMSFDGYGVSSSCFEGRADFFPQNGYHALYEVCL